MPVFKFLYKWGVIVTIAELHGKLPPFEGMEDLLTSDVFGTFRYLEPNQGLIPFLSKAIGFEGDIKPDFLHDVISAEYFFWPRTSKLNREPDLVIILTRSDKTFISLVIEAKYFSGKSNVSRNEQSGFEPGLEQVPEDYTHKPNFTYHDGDQLAESFKELIEGNIIFRNNSWAKDKLISSGGEKYCFYVTAHYARPRMHIEETLAVLRKYNYSEEELKKFFWVNWQKTISVMEETLSSVISKSPVRNLVEDLTALLKRKGLIYFGGYQNIEFDILEKDVYFWQDQSFFKGMNTGELLLNQEIYFWGVPE